MKMILVHYENFLRNIEEYIKEINLSFNVTFQGKSLLTF